MTNDLIPTNYPGALIPVDSQPLDQNPAAVYLAGLGVRSLRVQRDALNVIAGFFGAPTLRNAGGEDITCLGVQWAAIRYQHTQAIRSRLAEHYKAQTANRMLCALRGVLKAAWRLGQMSPDEMMRACDVKSVKGKTLPAGRALPQGEIFALFAACDNDPTPAGARDAAMIACMYPAGLRREEVVSLDLTDYDPQTGCITVRHGKGNKERVTSVEDGGRRAMADWLAIRGNAPGPLLFPINKGGKVTPRRMTNQAVYNALAKRGEQAKITDLSPHDLRRSFITDYIAMTGDMSSAKILAGHESINTTDRYNRVSLQAALDGMNKLHVPYRGRLVR